MSSTIKREISHDPRETDQGQRRSTRIYKKQQGGQTKRHEDRHSKSSISSKGSKMPKIVKSSSSTEEHKLEPLHSPNKRSPTVIKIHKDSDSCKVKTSSKVSFWGSPDFILRC